MTTEQTFPTASDESLTGLGLRFLSSDQLEIVSAEKFDWLVYDGTSGTIPTAFVYNERYWRLIDIQPYEHGWVYDLAPWPEEWVVRKKFILTPDEWNTFQEQEARRRAYEERSKKPVWILEPLLGFLPGRVQILISEEAFFFNTKRASMIGAIIYACIGLALAIMMEVSLVSLLPLAIFGVETIYRILRLFGEEEAIGMLLFEALYLFVYPFLPHHLR